jgi:hypothetical protein
MSYMRSLEGALQENADVEQKIPFWEFLDIEFDQEHRRFWFVAYYIPPELAPMLIRDFAAVLKNERQIPIGGCELANDKVDA